MDFDYYNPQSVDSLANVIHELPNYALLAGGTDLLVKMKEKLLRPMPQNVVDIGGISALRTITEHDGYIRIGAAVNHTSLVKSALIQEKAVIVGEGAAQIGSPQIRNMGTIGGNICNASPAADVVPPLLVLDGQVVIVSRAGQREVPLTDVFKGPGRICLGAGEFISQINIRPIGTQEGASFLKFGKRKALAIALINGAVWIKVKKGIIDDVRIALGSVAPTPVRLYEVETWLIGKPANDEVFAKAGELAAQSIKPIDDVRCKASYRTRLARVLVYRNLMHALERAQRWCECE